MKYRISPGSRYTEPSKRSTSSSLPDSAPFLLLACIGLWLVFGGYEKVSGGSSVPGGVRDAPASTI